MFDLNTILSAALTAAVAEATKPLLERIEKLENNPAQGDTLSPDDLVQVKQRIEALEGVDHERDHALTLRYLGGAREDIDALKARVWALEQATPETPAAISAAAFVTYLDQQEWFWNKINDYISRNMERADSAILAAVRDDENVKDTIREIAREAADAAVEEAINDHCSTYDHDDYDNVSSTVNDVDLADMVTTDNLRDEIKRVLRDVTVSIDV